MAEFPQIPATEPDVKPGKQERIIAAEPEMVYDKWWLINLEVIADKPNEPVSVKVILRKAAKLEDGSWRLSPKSGNKEFIIEDVFAKAETNPDLAQVLGGLLLQVQAIGNEMGEL